MNWVWCVLLSCLHSNVAASAAIDSMAAVCLQFIELCFGSYLLGFWSCRRLNGNNIDVAVITALLHQAQMPLKCYYLFALQSSQCAVKSNLLLLLHALSLSNSQGTILPECRSELRPHLAACLKPCLVALTMQQHVFFFGHRWHSEHENG